MVEWSIYIRRRDGVNTRTRIEAPTAYQALYLAGRQGLLPADGFAIEVEDPSAPLPTRTDAAWPNPSPHQWQWP